MRTRCVMQEILLVVIASCATTTTPLANDEDDGCAVMELGGKEQCQTVDPKRCNPRVNNCIAMKFTLDPKDNDPRDGQDYLLWKCECLLRESGLPPCRIVGGDWPKRNIKNVHDLCEGTCTDSTKPNCRAKGEQLKKGSVLVVYHCECQ